MRMYVCRLRLVSTLHRNLPQNQIVLKCLTLNSTPFVQYGRFEKVNVSRGPQWATEHAGEYLPVAGGICICVYIYISPGAIYMYIYIYIYIHTYILYIHK
jgi:hypothetical protein